MFRASSRLTVALSITICLPRQTLTPPRSRMLDVIDGRTRYMCLGHQTRTGLQRVEGCSGRMIERRASDSELGSLRLEQEMVNHRIKEGRA